MRLAGRVGRLERELGDKRGIAVMIAADFLHGGAPSFARIFDHRGFKLTATQRPPDEPWAAFVARAKGEAGETPGACSMLIGGLPEDVIDADRNLSVLAEPPKGSTRMFTVSDVQNPRTADANIGDSNRMAALESHMQRRQFGEARRN